MRLGQSNIPLLNRYLLTVFTCCAVASATQGQSKTMALNYSAVAQTGTAPTIRPLSIGDQVPDIVFENVLNYKSKKARLSDFKGKLVILDMWSVYCTSCIAAFPEMEKLQKEFGDKLQILLVNPHDPKYDSEEKIKTTLEKQKVRTGFYPSLPIPIHDSVLNIYFPHFSVPHQVWISDSGRVLAISSETSTTKGNIAALLQGQQVDIPIKNDWAFDKEKPLLVEDNGGSSAEFIYRSMLTKYKEGIGYSSGLRMNKDNKITGAYMHNQSLLNLISVGYSSEFSKFDNKRIILDVKVPKQYTEEFDTARMFCYDLTVPPTDQLNIDQYLCEDLRRLFNISLRQEDREVACMIIRPTKKLQALKTSYSRSAIDLESSSIKKFMHRYTISDLLKVLGGFFDKPFIDEVQSKELVDFDLPDHFMLSDTVGLLKLLSEKGFSIKEEKRIIKLLIITDK